MISIKNLTFSYTGSPPSILRNINLEISSGRYVSIVGENGCGKSTLMRLILHFLKPTEGTVVVLTKRIGYVPQKPDGQGDGFPITVYEVINSYRKLLKIKNRKETEDCLRRVGMLNKKDSLMSDLSGGQSQKVRIARALMGKPELLMLDEPSTGVDIKSQSEIYGLLKMLNQQNHITIVSIEHNLEAAVTHSTDIFHIKNGTGHFCSPQKYAEEIQNLQAERWI